MVRASAYLAVRVCLCDREKWRRGVLCESLSLLVNFAPLSFPVALPFLGALKRHLCLLARFRFLMRVFFRFPFSIYLKGGGKKKNYFANVRDGTRRGERTTGSRMDFELVFLGCPIREN